MGLQGKTIVIGLVTASYSTGLGLAVTVAIFIISRGVQQGLYMEDLRERKGVRASLAYLELTDLPPDVKYSYGDCLVELDLSHNKITDLKFLADLPRIQSIVLDCNHITSHVKIPLCRNLQTLWVNHNKINNLGLFISTLAKSCPNLRILSMMNNEAAPSFFNGGTFLQYMDYRCFVISSLPKLEVLDYTNISQEERSQAKRLYPAIIVDNRKKQRRKKDQS